jgi:hypothetical protein
MPRTVRTVLDSSKAGTTFPAGTAADVANGDTAVNDGRTLVLAVNSGVSTRTVTITPVLTVDGLAVAARTVSMPASTSKLLGPYEVGTYGDSLQISGDHTDLKFNFFRIPG